MLKSQIESSGEAGVGPEGADSTYCQELPSIPAILRIPTEVLRLILGWLPRPGDLYNISLTCRRFHEVGTELLYQSTNIRLFTHGFLPQIVECLVQPDHSGSKHIKNLEISRIAFDGTDIEDRDPDDEEALRQTTQTHLKLILELLEPGQLKSLMVFGNREYALGVETIEFFLQTQYNLQRLWISEDLLHCNSRLLIDSLPNLHTLDVDSLVSLPQLEAFYNMLVKKQDTIKQIAFGFVERCDIVIPLLDWTLTENVLLSPDYKWKESGLPNTGVELRALQHLSIDGLPHIDVFRKYSIPGFFVNLSALKTLRLYECDSADVFLRSIAGCVPSLEVLELFRSSSIQAFNTFINQQASLKVLFLFFDKNGADIDFEALHRLEHCLESFWLEHEVKSHHNGYMSSDLIWFDQEMTTGLSLSRFSKLTELALNIDDLDALGSFPPNLAVFRLLSFPISMIEHGGYTPQPHDWLCGADQVCRAYAESLKAADKPKLEMLSFDKSVYMHHQGETPTVYFVDWVKNRFGDWAWALTGVSEEEVRDEFWDSKIWWVERIDRGWVTR